jgi:hypothetical protein
MTSGERRRESPALQSCGKHDNGAQQAEDAIDGNADEPKRNQEDPDERIDSQRQQGQRPVQHQQDAPEQELHHI